MSQVYSLASVVVTIQNDIYGQVSFGGGNQKIGQISYSFIDKSFSIKTYADGGYAFSHKKAKSANVNVQINQTSSKYKELVKFQKWCHINPQLASSTMTVRDENGVMQFTAYDVFPEAESDNSVGEEAAENKLTFICGQLITEQTE